MQTIDNVNNNKIVDNDVDVLDPNKYFDCIYFINLDNKVERRTYMENKLQVHDIIATRIPGVVPCEDDNTLELTLKMMGPFRNKDDIKLRRKYLRGSYGCALAHIDCYKHALKNGYNRILILGDDIEFHARFKNLLSQACHKLSLIDANSWDITYIGGGGAMDDKLPYVNCGDDKLEIQTISNGVYGCYGYAINNSGWLFNYLITNVKYLKCEIDLMLSGMTQTKHLRVLRTFPKLVTENEIYGNESSIGAIISDSNVTF